jgi:hypothetical protein
MKSTIKIFLVVALFCGTAFADGDMGNGGRTGDMGNGGRDGDMGNGGAACAEKCAEPATAESSDVMTIISNYLSSMFE